MMDENSRNDRAGGMNESDEAGRVRRAAERAREAAGNAKDSLSAGASGVAEFTKDVAGQTKEKAGKVADFVREAETDEELKGTVSGTTARSLDKAGDIVTDAAPAIGRNAERAAEKLGDALHTIAQPLAAVLGMIAGTLGGWWKKAKDERLDLQPEDEDACRTHYASLTVMPDMTYERARTGYALGYVASRHPDYQGRSFDEIEPDLRQGFGDANASDYEALRDFTRYGYGRGLGR